VAIQSRSNLRFHEISLTVAVETPPYQRAWLEEASSAAGVLGSPAMCDNSCNALRLSL
jgi:hypothetical protein